MHCNDLHTCQELITDPIDLLRRRISFTQQCLYQAFQESAVAGVGVMVITVSMCVGVRALVLAHSFVAFCKHPKDRRDVAGNGSGVHIGRVRGIDELECGEEGGEVGPPKGLI